VQADGEVVVRLHRGSVLQTAAGSLQRSSQLNRRSLSVLQNLVGQVMRLNGICWSALFYIRHISYSSNVIGIITYVLLTTFLGKYVSM
jgi:hypothetical protein